MRRIASRFHKWYQNRGAVETSVLVLLLPGGASTATTQHLPTISATHSCEWEIGCDLRSSAMERAGKGSSAAAISSSVKSGLRF